jgi:hypothetical protein
VRQQIAHREARRVGFRWQSNSGQVAAHRGIEVDASFGDELHHGRRGDGLRGRPDLEERFRRDAQRMFDVGHTHRADVHRPLA